MSPRIAESGKPLSAEEVAAFEDRNGVALPDTYKQFLLRNNGGRVSPCNFDVPNWPGKWSSVAHFLKMTDEKYGLQYWYTEFDDRLPDVFLCIAVDPGGNFLCVGYESPYVGEIYYWDSSPDWNLTEETGTIFLVAKDVNEFLENLN